jgi:hypothetical protein
VVQLTIVRCCASSLTLLWPAARSRFWWEISQSGDSLISLVYG